MQEIASVSIVTMAISKEDYAFFGLVQTILLIVLP